jgi:hypothetical protein
MKQLERKEELNISESVLACQITNVIQTAITSVNTFAGYNLWLRQSSFKSLHLNDPILFSQLHFTFTQLQAHRHQRKRHTHVV